MKKPILIISFLLGTLCPLNLWAQSDFYDINSVREFRLYFQETNWDYILDSLYSKGDEERLLASILIDGTLIQSVGIRYKGFSSVSTDRTKNPFNIKLDYLINGQNYLGIDKIKLSNVIQDPSFVREVLSYEIARKYMPASQCNFAKLYINDVYWGVYTNVESVNKDFASKHFGSSNNSFFKCNPANLDFDGENSNLGNSFGTDSANYYPYYDLKSDYGWQGLYRLIDALNIDPANVEEVLNVDRSLWMHAFNYTLINFDSYVGYGQNYYIYEDHNGRFNPILWDLNMSFASYRLADASEYYDGFSIDQAKTIDPLMHYNSFSVYPRPLMRNLFENNTYRRMYLAHMRTIMRENFDNQDYTLRALYMQSLIDTLVAADTNKFYSYADFQDNLTSTVSDLMDYPGISELMDARSTYLSTYPGFLGAPDITNISQNPLVAQVGSGLTITANITNAINVILAYRFSGSELFTKVSLLDDGTQNDGAANDGMYGFILPPISNSVQYYIYAENDSAGRFSPERAAYEYYTVQSQLGYQDIVINEFMASNSSSVAGPSGEYDDWIELHNTTSANLSTAGLFLSDNPLIKTMWPVPDVMIEAGGYLIVWADQDSQQPGLHANFKLSSFGDDIYLSSGDGVVIDSVIFGAQTSDISNARYPNGMGDFIEQAPTHGWNNDHVDVEELVRQPGVAMYPNPAIDQFYLTNITGGACVILITDISGKQVYQKQITGSQKHIKIVTAKLASGIYCVKIIQNELVSTQKLIIQKL